jgi:hypothetical protein
MTNKPIRCIQLGRSTAQGPCDAEPTGRGTLDLGDRKVTGPLVEMVRGNDGVGE